MKRVLLTGGTGFVGANLARRLLREGHQVNLLVRSGFNPWRIEDIRHDVAIHEVDLSDTIGLRECIARIQPDWIFHLAVYGAYSSQVSVQRMITANTVGTINLVEACLRTGFEAFVNTGSSSEYGIKDHAPAENEWIEPNSTYAVTKAAATHYCHFIGQSRGVNIPTLRLYSIYGAYEEPTRLIPTLIVQGLEGKLPPLVNPAVARDYVYIDDAVDAFLRAASTAGQEPGVVYNVGSAEQTSLEQVVEIARNVLQITETPRWGSMADRKWDTTVWVADNRKIRERLGWHPSHRFAEGFRSTVDWLLENPVLLEYYKAHRQEPS